MTRRDANLPNPNLGSITESTREEASRGANGEKYGGLLGYESADHEHGCTFCQDLEIGMCVQTVQTRYRRVTDPVIERGGKI
jgi:hypothetical protein